MSPTPPIQFYKAAILIGGTAYPALPNTCVLTCPRNFAIPPIIGNFWAYNYADGLRQPVVSVQLVVRDGIGSGDVLSSTFLNYFMLRSQNDLAHDVFPISGGITFVDQGPNAGGVSGNGFVLGGSGICKANSFSLMASKGDDLIFNCTFAGTSLDTIGNVTMPGFDERPPLRFNNVNFLQNNLAGKVYRVAVGYTNNLTPNLALDGTNFPADVNAGMMQASLSLTMQGGDSPPVDETQVDMVIYGAGRPSGVAAHGNSGNSGSALRTFTLPNVINQTRDERRITSPRIMRSYDFACLGAGATGNITAPLVIT